MKKHLFCVAFILFGVLAASAQTTENTVQKIRAVYDDVAGKARLAEIDDDHGSIGDLVMDTLTINARNHQWRAVGIHQQTYKFFYMGGNTEEHMYPDQLVMVKVERHESDRTYNEEYLFSDAGVLLFYSQKAENDKTVLAERSVYFNAVKPIRLVEDGKTTDALSIKTTGTIKDILAESGRIKELFAKSLKL